VTSHTYGFKQSHHQLKDNPNLMTSYIWFIWFLSQHKQ
jgi:hypothetical protein